VHVTTDTNGRAESTLTLGQTLINTVGVSIGERELVMFDALGTSPYAIASLEGLAASFSPDGSLLAFGEVEGAIKLRNVTTQETIATLEGHTDIVTSVLFSPDGALIVSGAVDNTVKLWDVATQENVATFEGVPLSFSPDSTLLANGTVDETIELWDVATKETIAMLEGRVGGVNAVSFSPDGTLLAFGDSDGAIELWEVATKEIIGTLKGHTDRVTSVSFSPNGALLTSVSFDGTVKLWDMATRKTIATFEGNRRSDFSLFSPDGSFLAYSSPGGIGLWDVATRERINTLDIYPDFASSAVFHPNGNFLAFVENSASFDGIDTLKLWDVTTKENITTVGPHAGLLLLFLLEHPGLLKNPVLFSPDGNFLAYQSPDGIELWNAASYLTQLKVPKVVGDVNGDGVVNLQDLVLVVLTLGTMGQSPADVNADGVVDIRDLIKVAGELGNAAAAPSLHPQSLALFTAADVQQWLSQAQHLNLTDLTSQRGIRFLQQLLAALIPKETALLPNYPNPFNPETWIPYQLARPADVTLTIYTVNGQVVRQLALGHQLPGTYQSRSRAAYWDGRNAVGESVASGLYFYTLTAGEFTATRRMLILK
jgi:WD40 repeat protein